MTITTMAKPRKAIPETLDTPLSKVSAAGFDLNVSSHVTPVRLFTASGPPGSPTGKSLMERPNSSALTPKIKNGVAATTRRTQAYLWNHLPERSAKLVVPSTVRLTHTSRPVRLSACSPVRLRGRQYQEQGSAALSTRRRGVWSGCLGGRSRGLTLLGDSRPPPRWLRLRTRGSTGRRKSLWRSLGGGCTGSRRPSARWRRRIPRSRGRGPSA